MTHFRVVAATLAATFTLAAAENADAHETHAVQTLGELEGKQQRLLWHYLYVARHGSGRPRWWSRRASVWTRRELVETRQRMATVRYAIPAWARSAFLCIHRGEGAWDDPDGPYYGGVQMDLEFQRTYGPELLASKGTADHWTPPEQLAVAYRAYRSGRGFFPWPNTARACGLI